MAAYTYLKYVKVEDLTAAQRKALQKQLQIQRRAIQAHLKLVDRNLALLERSQRRKKA
jgi:hypothetical protein